MADTPHRITDEEIEKIAKVTHETNRAFCETLGDKSQVAFEDAPDWQKESARNGVRAIAEGRIRGPGDSHVSWMKEKEEAGWKYGSEKNPEAKTHPCMVPFNQLPAEQQTKDFLFYNVARTLLGRSL